MQKLSNRTDLLIRSKSKIRTSLAVAALTLASASASAEVMLGAYLPHDGFSRQVITDFNNVSAKNLAFVNVFSAFSHDWDNLYWQSTNVVAEGAYPMISWMPIDLNRRGDNLLPEIAIGMWDDYLTQWGTKLLAWVNSYPAAEQPRLSIRFAHEFNGNWYPYSNTPVAYVAAWQHIHDMFEVMGVNQHVDWVWSASKTNVDDYSDFTVYYPGEDYVDWTSLDGYNWGSNYSPNGWSSFKDVFTNAYNILVDNYPDKPIMIAETGSAEPTDIPNTTYGMYGDNSDAGESKIDWVSKMLFDIENEFPAIRALSLFNNNKELGWSITDQVNTGLDSWVAGTLSDYYTSDYLVASDGLFDAPEPEYLMAYADITVAEAELSTLEAEMFVAQVESLMLESDTLDADVTMADIVMANSDTVTNEGSKKEQRKAKQAKRIAKKAAKRASIAAKKAEKREAKAEKKAAKAANKEDRKALKARRNSDSKAKRLEAKSQAKLAKSKKPAKISEDRDRELAKQLRKLNKAERKEKKRQKMKVIDY